MSTPPLNVRVQSVANEAEGIFSFDLRPIDGCLLPPFTAGAHIDLKLPQGLERSYSLINPQDERHRYVIAVNRDAASRGGSRYICDTLRPGDVIGIAAPSNNFPLHEDAETAVLIAGGIGITPLWCMIQRLEAIGRSWRLFYAARTRRCAAFLDALAAVERAQPGRVALTFDQEPGQPMLDLAGIVAAAPPAAHLYCCGPASMLAAFETAASGRPAGTVHVEYFTTTQAPAAAGGFTVVLAKSGRSIVVPPGQSILDVLLAAGLDIAYACTEGVCGTCETPVLEGQPDHRDMLLSAQEKAANRTMMICCSGSLSERLVLDL